MNQFADRRQFGAEPRPYLSRTIIAVLAGVVLFLALLALIFQLFGRYEYRISNGVVWRIDRLTLQTCRISHGQAYCSASLSPSTSLSTSLSPSTSVVTGRDQTR